MSSPYVRRTATSGRQVTGLTVTKIIIGFPAHGLWLPKSAISGLPATGTAMAATMPSTKATGAQKLVSTEGSVTAMAISATATKAAAGITVILTTTSR